MQPEMIVNVISSIIISIIPFIIGWLSTRIRKETPQAILDLIGRRNKIVEEIKKQRENNSPEFIIDRLENLLESTDKQINIKTKNVSRNESESTLLLFKLLAAVEGFLFIGSLFGSTLVKDIVLGFSYESNVYFLEGIFKSPIVRILLIVIFFTSSLLLTFRINRKIPEKVKNRFVTNNLVSFFIFNICFILITLVVSFILAVLDPIIPIF